MSNFAATVTEWARQSEARLKATRNRAIELLADDMTKTKGQGGRVPFDTGNLARSLLASTSGMPETSRSAAEGSDVGLVTAKLALSQAIWLGYQAEYARRMNYGFVGADSLGRVYNQAGNYFVEGAIAQWPQFVDQAARELQSSVEGR
jgi:hypothetical protein